MKHGILATALLLTSAGFASADYVIIVANVGGGKELKTGGAPGTAGMQGGPAGMGMPGGMPPNMGMPGGMPPGMGMRGGQARGMRPGMGAMGAMGGMMGMRGGGMMMGMRGGMMMGMGGMFGSTDADDAPSFVIAVVEVKAKNLIKKMDQRGFVSVALPPRLGRSCNLLKNPPFGEMFVITEGKDQPIPTVSERFQAKLDKIMKDKPSIDDLLGLARWTLEHGLVDKFPQVMDKLVEIDKAHPAAVAYLKVKADLERKPSDDATVAAWRDKLQQHYKKYKVANAPHYLIIHNPANATAAALETHIEHLENSFRGFYYWFVLQEKEKEPEKMKVPAVPRNRQVVILTSDAKNFEELRKIFTSGPVVVDGFFARRENLAVMSSQRTDDMYNALSTYWKTWQDKGYQRSELLKGGKSGVPKLAQLDLAKTAEAQMLALMLKALEQEAELATVSHDASRQLLFASGLLPRNVAVPEWILFGMGSFFETPLESPWPTIGAPSPYYLPRWRELKNKSGLEKTRLLTLRNVVTDSYFRNLPPDGKAESEEHHLYESALRKARTVAWSLTYFLAQQKLDGLRNYFTELSKMPRDLELDDTVLLNCFARAFGCVDGNNKVNDAELNKLASAWYSYMGTVSFESEPTMKEIREKIAKKLKEAQDQAQKQQNNDNNSQPGMYPGTPGGLPPGAPGGPRPGMQPGRNNFPPTNPPPGGAPQPGGPPSRPGRPPRQR